MYRLPIALLLAFAGAAAQDSPGPLTQAVAARYNAVKENLIGAAEAMPADQYMFQLTPAQKTFGGWIEHTIMLNRTSCTAIQGAARPAARHSDAREEQGKDALVKALRESYDMCDRALAAATDRQLLAPVTINGRQSYPVAAAIGLIATSNSHYGNLVGYLRMKGITPPSTARTQKK